MSLALAGCGGGGGSSNGTGTGTGNTNVSITGTVKDTSTGNAPVVNSVVSIVGTSLTTNTDASGHFSFPSVPSTVKAFTVSNPNTNNYFSYANFGGKTYDVILCTFPLPVLHTGTNTVGEVDLIISSSSPPPIPPTAGCP